MGTYETAIENLAIARAANHRLWRTPEQSASLKWKISLKHRDGESQRQIARDLGVFQQYVCKILKQIRDRRIRISAATPNGKAALIVALRSAAHSVIRLVFEGFRGCRWDSGKRRTPKCRSLLHMQRCRNG